MKRIYSRVVFIVLGLLLLCLLVSCMKSRYEIPAQGTLIEQFGSGPEESLARSFRVLIWNVYKGRRKNWKQDFQRLARDVDLILIQEAYFPSPMKNVFSSLPDTQWNYVLSFRYTASGDTTGIAVGARAGTLGLVYLRSAGREPIVGTPKMAMLTRFRVEGSVEEILVANVHGLLVARTALFEEQMKQIAKQIAEHQGPVVWGGDFNTWSTGRLEFLRALTAELELTPVVFAPDTRTQVFGNPIDHAFVRGFEVVETKVHREIRSSDHKALEFQLRFSEENREAG